MIHLHRVDLLVNALRLPYKFVMPFSLFMDEWLSISLPEKDMLLELGLELQPVSGNLVDRASHYYYQHAELKLNDCFALVLSQEIENSILLSGDSKLRKVAESEGVTVHGVLWIVDELEAHGLVPHQELHDKLLLLQNDDRVYLPEDEISKRIRRLAQCLPDP